MLFNEINQGIKQFKSAPNLVATFFKPF